MCFICVGFSFFESKLKIMMFYRFIFTAAVSILLAATIGAFGKVVYPFYFNFTDALNPVDNSTTESDAAEAMDARDEAYGADFGITNEFKDEYIRQVLLYKSAISSVGSTWNLVGPTYSASTGTDSGRVR